MGRSSPGGKNLKGAHCAECRGHRLHEVRVVTETGGKVTRNMVCSTCETVSRLGVCCPKCGDARLKTEYTKHRGGATIRVRSCRTCGHKIRTKEIVECANAVPPAADGS